MLHVRILLLRSLGNSKKKFFSDFIGAIIIVPIWLDFFTIKIRFITMLRRK